MPAPIERPTCSGDMTRADDYFELRHWAPVAIQSIADEIGTTPEELARLVLCAFCTRMERQGRRLTLVAYSEPKTYPVRRAARAPRRKAGPQSHAHAPHPAP